LADHDKAQLVEAGERSHIRGREGNVRHVEVFQMGSVRTSILGRPRPLPGHRRADRSSRRTVTTYTLNWDEPPWLIAVEGVAGLGASLPR